jgi:glycine/D-amino acid oxidase-like deaminating enzyme
MTPPPAATSLWQHTAPPPPPTRPLGGSRRCDVAVVGGGILGLALALRAAERGADVVVLEAHGLGAGASGVNSGRITPGFVRNRVADVTAAVGDAAGAALARAFAAGGDEVFALIERHGIDCGAVRSGWITGAHTRLAVRRLRHRLDDWRELDRDLVWLDAERVRRLTGHPFHAGLLDPSGGHLDPLAYVRGLAAAAIRAGAHLHTDSAVTAVGGGPGDWRLATAFGTVSAPAVFLCVNGRARRLAPQVHKSVLPVHVFEMATAPLDAAARARVLPEAHMVSDTRNAVFAYHLRPEGRLLTGAITFPQGNPRRRVEREGRRHLRARLGLPRDVRIDHLWGGVISRALDSRPHLYEVDRGLWAPMACNGRGIASCTVAGRLCADFAAGDLDPPLAPEPPRPIPAHALAGLLQGPVISLSAVLDRLEP